MRGSHSNKSSSSFFSLLFLSRFQIQEILLHLLFRLFFRAFLYSCFSTFLMVSFNQKFFGTLYGISGTFNGITLLGRLLFFLFFLFFSLSLFFFSHLLFSLFSFCFFSFLPISSFSPFFFLFFLSRISFSEYLVVKIIFTKFDGDFFYFNILLFFFSAMTILFPITLWKLENRKLSEN